MKIRISKYRNLLIYEKEYSIEFIKKTIKSKNLNGLRIFADLPSKKIDDLTFLEELVFLKELSITMYGDVDFSFLLKLDNLRYFRMNCIGKKEINLIGLKNLQELGLTWRKAIVGLGSCKKLSRLFLDEYHEKDLLSISSATSIKELNIKSSGIVNLNGINNFQSLESLSIGGCRKLKYISHIDGLKLLKKLEFNGCKKIIDFDKLANLPNLEKIILNDCGEIKSSDLIFQLRHENKLTLLGSTKVIGKEFP